MQLTLSEAAGLLHIAPPAPASAALIAGYSIDSRTVKPGELFFAVRGQKLDGHEFAAAALESGALAAIIAEERRASFPAALQSKLVAVADPLLALQSLAAAVRHRWGGPLVAVTGSTGKTTTKQMIAALLRTRFRVRENEGNLNNHFGLPLSLLRLQQEDEIGVFELGMSAPGEIRLLASLAQPDIGVVTNVSEAHLEFFPDVDAIARAKRELVESLPAGSWAVLNADDARVRSFASHCRGSIAWFGMSAAPQFRAEHLEPDGGGGWCFDLALGGAAAVPLGSGWKRQPGNPLPASGRQTRFCLPLLGEHNVRNLLAALAVNHLLGIPVSHLAAAVQNLRPAAMRGELVRLANGALVVNDCYNSNPQALAAMLEAVAALPAQRRFAVLGGMLELGPESPALHEQCGRRLAELPFAGLFTVGEAARALGPGALAGGMPSAAVRHCDAPQEAGERLRANLREGDVVLLKASRSIHLEKIWECLGPRAAGETAAGAALRGLETAANRGQSEPRP